MYLYFSMYSTADFFGILQISCILSWEAATCYGRPANEAAPAPRAAVAGQPKQSDARAGQTRRRRRFLIDNYATSIVFYCWSLAYVRLFGTYYKYTRLPRSIKYPTKGVQQVKHSLKSPFKTSQVMCRYSGSCCIKNKNTLSWEAHRLMM